MTEYMTHEEVVERERAIDAFMLQVDTAEKLHGLTVSIRLDDAIEIRNELERLAEIEKSYDNMMSAAEDRRWD